MTQQQQLQVQDEGFDAVTLGENGAVDIEATAQAIASKTGASSQDDKAAEVKAKEEADAKAKAEAEAKAKAEAEAKAKADEAAKAAAAAGTSAAGETKIDGVLARDGKHVIPYAVLESERGRASAAEAKAAEEAKARAEAEKRAAELQARLKKAEEAGAAGADVDADMQAIKAQLGALESVPEVADILKGIVSRVEKLDAKLASVDKLEESVQQRAEREQQDVRREIQEAIDANPKLSYAQAKDPDTWNRIADQDAVLRADPKMRNLSFSERFAKAVTAVEAVHGEIKVPAEFLPKTEDPAPDAAAKAKAEAEAKAKAEQAKKDEEARAKAELEKAGAAQRPITLSDLPGGTTPATDDRGAGSLNPDEIASKVDSFLEKGGRVQDIPGLFTVG